MYICLSTVHAYAAMYTHIDICMRTHTHMSTYIHTYILTYLHTYLHTYIPTYIHTYIYRHKYMQTPTGADIHKHTCMHTYPQIHKEKFTPRPLLELPCSWDGSSLPSRRENTSTPIVSRIFRLAFLHLPSPLWQPCQKRD